jgi:hypothetical protein
MSFWDYLLIRSVLRSRTAPIAIVATVAIFLVFVGLSIAGADDLGRLMIEVVLYAGVVALPVCAILWSLIWLIAIFGPADRKPPRHN